jgi:hypothetical protein
MRNIHSALLTVNRKYPILLQVQEQHSHLQMNAETLWKLRKTHFHFIMNLRSVCKQIYSEVQGSVKFNEIVNELMPWYAKSLPHNSKQQQFMLDRLT